MRTLRPAWAICAFGFIGGAAGCGSYGPPLSFQFHEALLGHSQSYVAEGLLSPSALVRRWSIVTLARYGEPGPTTDAFILMLDTTQEPVPLVRATAAVGLRVLGDKRAIPALVTACSDPEPIVRADAVRTLGDLGGPPEFATLGPLARRDPDPNVRLEAVYALQKIGGEDTIPIFIGALGDPDESVAFAAHAALMSRTGQQFSPDKTQWQKWWQEQHPAPRAKP